MSNFQLSSSLQLADPLNLASPDPWDLALDAAFDRIVDVSQEAIRPAVDESIPVDRILVEAAPATGPDAWRVTYVITDADHLDPRMRPPVERFAITRADRAGQQVNAAAVDVLAIEMDTLAADHDVHWTVTQQLEAYGAISVRLASSIGVSGTPRDRLVVEIRAGAALRYALADHARACIGSLFRLLDFSGARFDS